MSTPLDRIRKKVNIVEPHTNKDEDTFEELVSGIVQNAVSKTLVPVVCEDMFEYINPDTKERQSLQSYIVEQVITKNVSVTDKEVQEMLYGGYAGMSLLYNKCKEKFYKRVNSAVLDEHNNVRKGIVLKEEVRDFLVKGRFPLIITTSCFRIIETILDGYTTFVYEPNGKNDEEIIGNSVYHIFGESTAGKPICGIDEWQILKYLKSLYSTDYAPKNLMARLNDNQNRGTLLFLGNNAPDWLFRFILLPMYPAILDQEGNGFYLNGNHQLDDHLERFLKDISFETEDEMVAVLKKAVSKLPSSNTKKDRIRHNKKFDFFLSYASEDKEYALQLKDILEYHGLNVWFDDSEIKDGAYWQRIIHEGIEDTAIFLPLISASYINKVRRKKERIQVLQKYGLETLPHDAEMCLRVNKDEDIPLSGVQVELLLAESQYANQEVRSIPVILSDEVIEEADRDIKITPVYIENTAKDSRSLPEKLFSGIQMYGFDKNNPSSFVLEWDRYKGNK